MKKKLLLLLALPLLILAGTILWSPHAKAFNYTDQLMDDSVFRASGTMSAADIQAFLVSKNSTLANFASIEDCGSNDPSSPNYTTRYSFYATYYSCGGWASASKIIYDSSQAYGINPQVILATLQKEQSLITAQHPEDSQYAYAMGYGCPDSGGCGYAGFFNQVDNATWQFRFDFERASGNNSWWNNWSYPCNGATRYYSQALLPNRDVTFYDDYGTGYTHFVIPNASTATLYCYTPHVYPGSSQQYYSGSYWFVYYFMQWFVPYSAQPVSQQVFTDNTKSVSKGWNATLLPGENAYAQVRIQNTGSATWTKNGGVNDVRLATYDWGRISPFCAGLWIPTNPNCTRASALISNATGGSTVAPGETGIFEFPLNAPTGIGLYNETFGLVIDGKTVFNNGRVNFQLNVTPPNYSAQPIWQSIFTDNTKSVSKGWNATLLPGENAYAVVVMKNTGNFTWTNSGANETRLATYDWARQSAFCPGTWFYQCTRPARMTEASVAPGQTGTFEFPITAPQQPRVYNEGFGLVIDGKSTLTGSPMNFQLNVTPPNYSAQPSWQQIYTNSTKSTALGWNATLSRGSTAWAVVVMKNTGNFTWTKSGGTYDVRLGTYDWARQSPFCTGAWIVTSPTCTRPVGLSETSVAPGGYGTFEFPISVPANQTLGLNNEGYGLVVDGKSILNGSPMNFQLTIQ